MKNLLFLVLSIAVTALNAQVISLTPRLGMTYSNFYHNDLAESTFRPGLCAGLTADYALSDKLSFASGLSYEQKGGKYSLESSSYSTYQLDYLCLPLLMKVYLGRKNSCFLNGGVVAGYLLRGIVRNSFTDGFGIAYKSTNHENLSLYNRFDPGLAIGGGYLLRLNPSNAIRIEVLYDLSLSSVNKDENALSKPKLNSFQLCLGYQLGLRRN